jgi:exodeoxyribonuclease VII small subunit
VATGGSDTALDVTASFFYCPPMSKSVRANDAAKNSHVPFEEALKKLEAIVEAMESGDLPLEALLVKYEEGTKLAQICQARLAEADLKIQQLEQNAAGEPILKPFEGETGR